MHGLGDSWMRAKHQIGNRERLDEAKITRVHIGWVGLEMQPIGKQLGNLPNVLPDVEKLNVLLNVNPANESWVTNSVASKIIRVFGYFTFTRLIYSTLADVENSSVIILIALGTK